MTDSTLSDLKPKRIEALHRDLHDELLIYDPETYKGHCLNKSAALIWSACDGEKTVSEIAEERQIDEAIVWFALVKFEKAGLLSDAEILSQKIHAPTRREILRKLGTAAVFAVPIVMSVLVPTPAQAASCFPLLHPCSSNAQCCSGHCGLSGASLVCLP